MTMVNGVLQGAAAYLYGDTAIIEPASGCVLAFDSKMRVGQHFPWAVGVTFSGNPKATEVLEMLNEKCVEDVIAQLPLTIAAFKAVSTANGAPDATMRLVLAAWDEDCGVPRLFVAGDGLEAFERSSWCPPGVTEVSHFFGGDNDPSGHWRGATPCDPAAFDVQRDGLAVFETRRRIPYAPVGGGMALGNYVGGAVQMATISEAGVECVQLRQWPDEVGKPIQPRAAE